MRFLHQYVLYVNNINKKIILLYSVTLFIFYSK